MPSLSRKQWPDEYNMNPPHSLALSRQILDLPSRANSTVIKSHYRRLSLKYHPDKNPGNRSEANKQFNQVAKAYKVTRPNDGNNAWM